MPENQETDKSISLEEKDYRILLRDLPEGVGITDIEENLLYVNEAFAKMLGYTSEELTGRNVASLIPPDEKRTLKEETELRAAGRSSAYNLRMLNKNGEEIIVRVSGVPRRSKSGEVIGTMAVVIDITSGEKTEQMLRKLSRAVEQSPTSVVITDACGTIEYVNPKFTELTGYSESEAIGENPRVLKSGLTPEETYVELWKEITAGREWRGVFVNKKKNGDLYWEDAWISPIKQPNGAITHFVAVKQDISRRVEAERLLQYSLRDLELYSSFLQHDMRNDLQLLLNHIEASLMMVESRNPIHGYLETAEGVAERMVRLLDVFGRPGSEERNLEKILMKAKAQAEKAHSNLQARIEMKTKDPVFVSARLLPMVFDNLMRNSAEFAAKSVEVIVEVSIEEDTIVVLFTDSGPGISEEVKQNLFDKGASTTGGGYGLYLSRKVIQAYGGSMNLVQHNGEGAAFRITLPIA
ncbi:PAS domain S-box protein [Candidatus Thorarchaeota archaeon]|nr:MAG: PAS domain S-box protein [Candidatus Thorarchaeota archaeon]